MKKTKIAAVHLRAATVVMITRATTAAAQTHLTTVEVTVVAALAQS